MRNGIIIRRLENLRTFGNRGGAARLMTFAQGFSVVLGEVSQGRLGVFVDRANRRDKTGVEKRLHAFAKLVGRAFVSRGDVRLEGLAADRARRALLSGAGGTWSGGGVF